ncbi:MAG: hypothetical protein HYT48_00230 [Candidatus Vogelbacteria bacterium]|nr:hypothetical protein [Candidatus Vogelbacteria bacterium]
MVLVGLAVFGLSFLDSSTMIFVVGPMAAIVMGIFLLLNYLRGVKTGRIMDTSFYGVIIRKKTERTHFFIELILCLIFGAVFILVGFFALLK